MKESDLLKAIKLLNKARISVHDHGLFTKIPHPHGGQEIVLKPEELRHIINDRDSGIARHFGVTKEHYLYWKTFIENPQCQAATRQGQQCKNFCHSPTLQAVSTPDKFSLSETYLCPTHEIHEGPVLKFQKGH